MRIPHVTQVECEAIATGERYRGARLSGISLAGVQVDGIPPLAQGATLRLWLTLPSLRMDLLGEVVSSSETDGMKLRFGSLPTVHQVVILELMRGEVAASGAERTGPQRIAAGEPLQRGGVIHLRARKTLDPTAPPPEEAPESSGPESESEAAEEIPVDAGPPAEESAPAASAAAAESDAAAPEVTEPAAPDAPGAPGAAPESVAEETQEEAREEDGTAEPAEVVDSSELVEPAGSLESLVPDAPATTGARADDAPTAISASPDPHPPAPDAAPSEASPSTGSDATASGAPRAAVSTRPPAPAPQASAGSAPAPGDEERRRRVLVVDDHDRTRAMLRGMIEGRQREYEVTEARDGMEGVEIVQSQAPFDLIFLDVDMPRLNGLGACRKLRELGVKAPIIFLTGRGELEDFKAGREAGADTYIKKPIVLGTLRSMLSLFTSGGMSRR